MGRQGYRKYIFFTVLRNLNYEGQSVGQNVGQNVGQKLKPDDRRKHIIEIIEGNSQVTALDLSKIFYVSERTIEWDLRKLTDEKVIEYTGSAKDGYWIVKK
ncbi:MAG: winged helix-turn-helix transcriptional regulator [Filifactor alocis]|uniref:winged helix-turn-helix transcriptional regulator n=1 Tax=Filifactor alocis TaxID=143361 RepID=UPI003FA078A4